jgi:ethanolamine utilization protein EutA
MSREILASATDYRARVDKPNKMLELVVDFPRVYRKVDIRRVEAEIKSAYALNYVHIVTHYGERLWTKESGEPWGKMPENVTLSFSGGVADCIEKNVPWLTYGDMGPVLGQVIRKSRLCQGEYVLGDETIRATVIGAGCHSAQLSGSTVFYQNVDFPLQNVPVVTSAEELERQETAAILALAGQTAPTYGEIKRLAGEIAEGFAGKPVYVCLEQDMAKALGQALALRLGKDKSVLCIDRVRLDEGSYLDVGAPVGPALPVVVKTLVLGR